MDVRGFIFYTGFWEALKELSDEDFGKIMRAVGEYVFEQKRSELNGVLKSLFSLMKPQLDANLRKLENGKKGGRPSKKDVDENQTKTKSKPNDNQSITQKENKKENKNENKNENIYCSPAANSGSKNNGTHNAEKREVDVTAEKVFEKLWELYPLKRGKNKVSEANKRRLLDIGLDEMIRAVERYKADLDKETWRKPQNGSTFFNGGYIDYLDSNYTALPPGRGEVKKNRFDNFPGRNWDFDEIQRLEETRRMNQL